MKNENAPIPQPFLDWYDIWPGQAGRDEHGRSWVQAPPQGVRLRVQHARMSDTFFQPECPWEAGGLGPKVVLFDEGRYRMWYGVAASPDYHENLVCYAESDDGFDWVRPELGIYESHGSTANNIVCDQNTFYAEWLVRRPVCASGGTLQGNQPGLAVLSARRVGARHGRDQVEDSGNPAADGVGGIYSGGD